MVERVSRAIYYASDFQRLAGKDPYAYDSVGRAFSQKMGRAAIEAMQIPTAHMLASAVMSAVAWDPDSSDYAATSAVLELLPPTGHPEARKVIAEIRRDYRAAIKSALTPTSPQSPSMPPETE